MRGMVGGVATPEPGYRSGGRTHDDEGRPGAAYLSPPRGAGACLRPMALNANPALTRPGPLSIW